MHEVMGWPGPITDRQYDVYQEWLTEEWDNPNRTDHYLMAIERAVRQSDAELKTFRLQREKPPTPLTPEQRKLRNALISKMYAARFGR